MSRYTVSLSIILLGLATTPALAEPDKASRSAALPYYNRANRYLSQGRFEDAERDLLQAIHLYPDEPDFHTNLGVAYRKLDRYADAEHEFKIAIAYNRDDWMNWSNLANAYLKQNMLEKTIATFEETLKHNPPAKEVAAIKQDLIDIKKVLASQGPSQGKAQGLAGGNPSEKQDSSTSNSSKRSKTAESTKILKTPSKAASSTIKETSNTVPTGPGVGKQSEWGYDDKKSP